MNKILFLFLILLLGFMNFACSKSEEKISEENSSHDHREFYTCTMHPQIKEDKPGKCPICHMDLVMIKQKINQVKEQGRGNVEASENDLKLIGVQKYFIEKMDLLIELPVSGRFISQNEIAFQIYENDISEIKVGGIFKGRSAILSELELKGKIISIDHYVDATSRTIRIVGKLDQTFEKARIESTFHGFIIHTIKNIVVIPQDSVLHTGKRDLVYLFQKDGSLKPQEVSLGVKSLGYYQVLSGVSEGDEITVGANFLLDSESKIRGIRD